MEDQDLLDIFGYIQMIQDCHEQAETNEWACLEGIIKADIVLHQIKEDTDIQCIALMERAELLYIAVKNKYDTDHLAKTHGQPLDSCIKDCEQVLSKVSENRSAQSIRDKATSLLSAASQLKKPFQLEARAKKAQFQQRTSAERPSHSVFQSYDPTKTLFRNISKINSYLLQDIVNCFKKAKQICRTCYYKHGQISPHNKCKVCRKPVAPLVLIPASKMCDNLARSTHIAVPLPPKMLMTKGNEHKFFQMCKNKDHTICCDKSASGDTWFAHSIEELVIWTVERHYGCNFTEYIDSYHKDSDSPNHNLFDKSTQAATANARETSAVDLAKYSGEESKDGFDYYPDDCLFKNLSAIPERLLFDVIDNYHGVVDCCRWCFYGENKMYTITTDKRSSRKVCPKCHADWSPVVVTHASKLCWNFGRFDYLPIAPWPAGKPTKDSFEYCKKKDHFRCFHVYVQTEFWYPHSVEEMIVWTVEREKNCTFPTFIKRSSQIPRLLIPAKQTNTPTITPTYRQAQPAARISPVKTVVSSPTAIHTVKTFDSTMTAAIGIPNKAHQQTQPAFKAPSGKPIDIKTNSVPNSAHQQAVPVNATGDIHPVKMKSRHMSPPATGGLNISSGVQTVTSSNQELHYANTAATGSPTANFTSPKANINSRKFEQGSRGQASQSGIFPILTDSGGMASTAKQTMNRESGYPVLFISKPRAVPVTAVDISLSNGLGTMSNGRGATFGSIMAPSTTVHSSYRSNYGVASFPGSIINGGHSMTYEVQALPNTPLTSVISPRTQQVFKFSDVTFKQIKDIPLLLLKKVATCFKDKKEVCRHCFYEERAVSLLVQATNMCDSGDHQWSKPLLIIPGCLLCDNEPCFEQGDHVPIPPLPPVAIIKTCQQNNHHKCFIKSLKSNEKFAHSVEALVVWIVESEEECSFEDYTLKKQLLQGVATDQATSSSASSVGVPPALGMPLPISRSANAVAPKLSLAAVTVSNSDVSRNKPLTASVIKPPTSGKLYHPKGMAFVAISSIPVELLVSVAEAYKSVKLVCRVCFFESDCENLTQGECTRGHYLKPITVIHGSPMCVGPSKWIPIPPLPNHMKQSKAPFVICKKEDHHACYAMSRGTNPWFPHTVEEMVIWTVERETGLPYEDVYERYLPANKSVQNVIPATIIAKGNSTRVTKQSDAMDIDFPPLTKQSSSVPYHVTEPIDPLLNSGVDGCQQSPSFKLDLDAAIKLAKAFPNLLPNSTSQPLFQGTEPPPNGNSLGLNACIPLSSDAAVPPTDSALDFFPALLDDAENDDFGVFMNSSSVTKLQLGQHGEIGDKKTVPSWSSPEPATSQSTAQDQTALRNLGSQKGELHEPVQSHVTIPAENRNQSVPSGHRPSNTGPPVTSSQVPSDLNDQPKESPSHVGQSKFADGGEVDAVICQVAPHKTNGEIMLAQVPNSEINAEGGFVEVKSKRKRRGLASSPPKSVYASSASTVATGFKTMEHQSPRLASLLDSTSEDDEGAECSVDEWGSSESKFSHGLNSVKLDYQSVTHPSNLMKNIVTSYELENSPNDGQSKDNNSNKTKVAHGTVPGLFDSNGLDPAASPPQQCAKADSSRVSGNTVSHLQLAPVMDYPSNGHSNDPIIPTGHHEVIPPTSSQDDVMGYNLLSKSAPSASDAHSCCLVCYKEFSSSDDFLRHCESASHCGAVVITTGGDKLPKCPPPHLKECTMELCSKHDGGCPGGPHCKLAHSQEQLSAWRQEWTQICRGRREMDGVDLSKLPPAMKTSQMTRGLCLSQIQSESEYPEVVVNISKPCSVDAPITGGQIEWMVTLQGQNWQTLFGVNCHTPLDTNSDISPQIPTFSLTSITSDGRFVAVKGPVWEARNISQGFLLGTVCMTVIADIPSVKCRGQTECELRLNVGFKEYLYLPLTVKTTVIESSENHPAGAVCADPSVDSNGGTVFVPHHNWSLSQGSDTSYELGDPNIEGEDTTLHHETLDDWGCSLTDDSVFLK